mgnify:CR=1 FL=1
MKDKARSSCTKWSIDVPGAPDVDGVTVCVRKFALSSQPDDTVAVVFQRVTDATIVDDVLESRIAKMIRPLTLRYCNTLRSFCADICFATDDVSTRGLVDTLL